MEKITFKQFNAFIEAPLDGEQLDEIFGMFKSAEEKEKAEMEKLELLAKRGNESAKMKLRDIQLKKDKAEAGKKAKDVADAGKFAFAKANAEVADKGRSDAYAKETGSVKSAETPVWDAKSGKWVQRTKWSHVGKHD